MKKITLYISFFTVSLAVFSCKKDFLERPPLDSVSEATFWKNSNDVYLAVNGLYNQLIGDGIIYDDGATDNADAQYPWESFATDASAGTILSTANAGWNYIDIRRVNYFLANADKVQEIDAALLERYKAEARFLRAFFYARLVQKFGSVPLVTKVLELNQENVPQNTRAEVIKFITDELDAVSKVLPAQYDGGKPNEIGRATKGAALALKARVYLYEGQWQQAADASAEVMKLGYSLYKTTEEDANDAKDDYKPWVDFIDAADERKFRLGLRSYEGVFREKNEQNTEVIFDRQQIVQRDPNFLNTYLVSGTIGGWSSVTPTQELVNSYGSYKTGEPVTPPDAAVRANLYTSKNPAFANEYRNRDPRLYATVLFENAPWNAIEDNYKFTWVEGASNMTRTGYNFRKMVDPTIFRERVDNYANIILIRYAEVLLTYAEAKNEISGPDPSVYAALDDIRTRAGMPPVNQSTYANQAALRGLIRNERRIELALEGQRYMDIRRWQTAPQVMKTIFNIKNTQVQQRTWNNKLYLMPVPQAQIDLSKGVLKQNPGY